MKKNLLFTITVGVLASLSFILMLWEIPVLPAYPFLKFEASDLPALIGGILMGPWAAAAIEFVKNIIHFFVKNDGTGGIGNLANFIVGCALTVPPAIIMKRKKTLPRLVIGLVIGVVTMVAVGAVANYFVFLPLWGIGEHTAKMTMILAGIIPINVIKAIPISILGFILYIPLSKALKNTALMSEEKK